MSAFCHPTTMDLRASFVMRCAHTQRSAFRDGLAQRRSPRYDRVRTCQQCYDFVTMYLYLLLSLCCVICHLICTRRCSELRIVLALCRSLYPLLLVVLSVALCAEMRFTTGKRRTGLRECELTHDRFTVTPLTRCPYILKYLAL